MLIVHMYMRYKRQYQICMRYAVGVTSLFASTLTTYTTVRHTPD